MFGPQEQKAKRNNKPVTTLQKPQTPNPKLQTGIFIRYSAAMNQKHRIRSIIGGSIGNLVEWYDWYAYSFFSVYFAPVFFPMRILPHSFLNRLEFLQLDFLCVQSEAGCLAALLINKAGKRQ